jgi:RNA polymerase sigma-70 factor (ECF subfamily)
MAEDNVQVDAKDDIVQLIAEHYQPVYRYAYRLSGSATEAEDLTQQVFLIANRNLGQLRSLDSARNWLFKILRNYFLRDRQNAQRIPITDAPVNLDHLPREVPEIPTVAEIDPERLQLALNALPDASRAILGMFYYEECSYKEIAEQLCIPIGTVMSRLARAKSDLRDKLLAGQVCNLPPNVGPISNLSRKKQTIAAK